MARRRFSVSMKKGVNIPSVIGKTTATIIALYVGNEIINQVGSIVNCTQGPFNNGFKLIGWTVGTIDNNTCSAFSGVGQTFPNVVSDVSGAGVLSVIGVVGIASIVMEFVTFNMRM